MKVYRMYDFLYFIAWTSGIEYSFSTNTVFKTSRTISYDLRMSGSEMVDESN